MHSARTLMFSRAYHRAGLPGPSGSWDEYVYYVDTLARASLIDALGEIWWDVRVHPGLSTVEIRAFDAQASLDRTGASSPSPPPSATCWSSSTSRAS